jgi:hypothetical protein
MLAEERKAVVHLISGREHRRLLVQAVLEAERSVIATSHRARWSSINPLADAAAAASVRGVSVMFASHEPLEEPSFGGFEWARVPGLHGKVAIIDQSRALVTSYELLAFDQAENSRRLELGLLIDSPSVAEELTMSLLDYASSRGDLKAAAWADRVLNAL